MLTTTTLILWIQAHKRKRQLEAEILVDPMDSVKLADVTFKYHVPERIPSCKFIRLFSVFKIHENAWRNFFTHLFTL